MEIGRIRKDFPVLKRVAYLASASVAPMSTPALEAIRSHLEKLYIDFDSKAISESEDVYGECRKLASRLINASAEEIALIRSTTEGINLFASGIPWNPGDRILLNDMEYPANVIPWYHQARLHRLEVKVVASEDGKVPLERLAEEMDERTKVVAVSHVEFVNGFRHELKELAEVAHANGALLFVDGIQSLGAIQVDVRRLGIDGLAAGGYKWLCGPVGTGLVYIRKELIKKIEPAFVGFESLGKEGVEFWERVMRDLPFVGDYKALAETAKRFEYGSMSPSLFKGFAASVKYLQGLSLEWIEPRIAFLTDYLMGRLNEKGYEILTPQKWEKRAGIVLFLPKLALKEKKKTIRELEEVEKRLINAGVCINIRGGGIRVSCHFFNTEGGIERLLNALSSLEHGGV